jgi:uncharacterized damage-inducible protein DinB
MVLTDKEALQRYLKQAHEALLWKVEGLSEYDLRRPLVPTGTNLLGLVKHVATVEAGYLGDVFGRPFPEKFPWNADDAEDNADMWATAEESSGYILDLYKRVWAHSDATVEALDLNTESSVPWWGGDANPVTFHRIIVHMLTELNRHLGHADILRELIDGAIGHRPDLSNLPEHDEAWWSAYRERLEETARLAGE